MFAKWTRPHGADDAETWSDTEEAPTVNGWEMRHDPPPVLISSTAAGLVRETPWPVNGPVFGMTEAVSGMRSDGWCENCGHDGSSGRMFPDFLASVLALPAFLQKPGTPSTTPSELERSELALADALSAARGKNYGALIRDVISATYSPIWMTSGTVSRGELSMRAGSECPSGAIVCSLSDVLETRAVPRKYWLSARAAAGILRRAAKRGKQLPTALQRALEVLATGTATHGTLHTSPPSSAAE